jgi:hypothetical protein
MHPSFRMKDSSWTPSLEIQKHMIKNVYLTGRIDDSKLVCDAVDSDAFEMRAVDCWEI